MADPLRAMVVMLLMIASTLGMVGAQESEVEYLRYSPDERGEIARAFREYLREEFDLLNDPVFTHAVIAYDSLAHAKRAYRMKHQMDLLEETEPGSILDIKVHDISDLPLADEGHIWVMNKGEDGETHALTLRGGTVIHRLFVSSKDRDDLSRAMEGISFEVDYDDPYPIVSILLDPAYLPDGFLVDLTQVGLSRDTDLDIKEIPVQDDGEGSG